MLQQISAAVRRWQALASDPAVADALELLPTAAGHADVALAALVDGVVSDGRALADDPTETCHLLVWVARALVDVGVSDSAATLLVDAAAAMAPADTIVDIVHEALERDDALAQLTAATSRTETARDRIGAAALRWASELFGEPCYAAWAELPVDDRLPAALARRQRPTGQSDNARWLAEEVLTGLHYRMYGRAAESLRPFAGLVVDAGLGDTAAVLVASSSGSFAELLDRFDDADALDGRAVAA